MPDPVMTPGTYLRKRREAARLSIADVAAKISTIPRMAEHIRMDWLELIESDQMPATFYTIVALHQIVPFSIDALVALSVEGREAPQLCRICGCSDLDPCQVGSAGFTCSWVPNDSTLCTTCVDAAEIDALITKLETQGAAAA